MIQKVLGATRRHNTSAGKERAPTNPVMYPQVVAKYNVSDTNLLPCFLQASSTHDSSVAHLGHPSAVQKG